MPRYKIEQEKTVSQIMPAAFSKERVLDIVPDVEFYSDEVRFRLKIG